MTDLPAAVAELIAQVSKTTKSDPEELGRAVEKNVARAKLPLTVENASAALVVICDKRGFGAVGRKVVGVRENEPVEKGRPPTDGEEREPPKPLDQLRPAEETRPWPPGVEAAASKLDYAGAKKALAGVLRFPRPTDYDALLLWAVQSRILELLERVFYLGIGGPKSSGKTTATRVARYLGFGVVEAGQLTAASIPAAMAIARGLAIDEVDVLLRRPEGETLAGILRQGTDRDQPYLKMVEVQSGNGRAEWKLRPIPVFGPKVVNFKSKVDDALASRADYIKMNRARDPKIRRAAGRYRRALAPVKCWLDHEAERALGSWTRDRVATYEESAEFEAASDALVVELDRTGQIGDLQLLIGRVMGWPIAAVVQERLGIIDEHGADDLTEEVRLALLAYPPSDVPPEWEVKLRKSELKARVDSDRRSRGLKDVWANALAEALDDLGLEDVRYSETDRSRAVTLTASDVARLRDLATPKVGQVGQVGRQAHFTDGEKHQPTSPSHLPAVPEGGTGAVPALDSSPTLGPGEVGRGRSPSEKTPSRPTSPTSPSLGEAGDPDPGDLFAGRETRADRARKQPGGVEP